MMHTLRRLQWLRADKDMTQKQVADYLNIDRTTYVKYERGYSEPSIESLKKLSKLFEVSIDYLLDNSNYKHLYPEVDEFREDQHRLLRMYELLTEMEKGEILGELKVMTKGRENQAKEAM